MYVWRFEARRERCISKGKRNEGEKKTDGKKESNVISFPFEGKTQKKCYRRI